MYRPIQPQFKIRVFNGKRAHLDTLKGSNVIKSSDESYIDVEPCVAYPVEYHEGADLLNTLQFTVDKEADLLLYYFYIGQSIIFYGGYYAENGLGMRHLFSGTVTRVKTHFANNGKISFSVECMSYGFTKFGKDMLNFVYPDSESSRRFARAESLSLMQIVEGIAKENNFDIGEISLSAKARNVKFNKSNIRYQKGISDWQFLTELAQDFGCNVWITTENGVEKLNFVSHDKAFHKQSEISFVFPLYGLTNKELKMENTFQESEIQKFNDSAYNRPRILRDVTVDEDISQAYAVSRSAVYFDKTTGEYKESLSRITTDKDGNNTITFYELDEQRVAYVNKNMPDIAEKIRKGSPTSLPWGTPDNPECASYYYTAVRVYDEHIAVFDKAFFGITVTAKCNQDLDIRSQRTYKIRGILSYHSKNLNSSFFLRSLKHIWDSDGTWTELDFIR